METQFLDPTPDRKLLDHNFEGYKLTLHNTKIITTQLSTPVLRIIPGRKHYTLLHGMVFDMHNCLVGEKANTYENVYFFDRNKNLRKARLDVILSKLEICKLWKFPDHEEVTNNDNIIYHPSIKLISENLAIASDGVRTFFLLETGDRSTDNKWEILHSEELLQGKGFYIQDAVLKDLELHVLLCSIEFGKRSHLAVHWITLINESNIWRQKSLKELCVEGNARYIYLERSCEAIYVASTISCRFVFDSENIIMDTSDAQREQVSKLNFKWSQDSNYVAIHFIMPNDIEREDVKVSCTSSYITVEYKNSSLLDGALYSVIHTELTTISISKNLLEITMAKTEEGDEWSSLLRDFETSKQYVGGISENLDHSASDESENPEQVPLFNKDAVEECDFANSEHTILERMCANTHKITHRCSLGTSPVLLTMEPNNRKAPSFGVRYDVDLCVWEPCFEDNNFELKHTTTLLALGYIQATTERKKFLCCPSNFEFTVICDMSRHIFLYRQNRSIESGELINRRTGSRPKKAEQRVFSVPNEEILGVYAVPLGIYILGETYLMYIEA
ncbi:nudC domain-containing protein 1 [Coccinella septempunctata]|uniref:nudC domain-containing protein 1 n=1 Tax=Coccinella septempunctata TaxID=41139 RepID=UPI001D069E8C|nr:nudC domain-containing protein 1 [Coccinella septempunctata]